MGRMTHGTTGSGPLTDVRGSGGGALGRLLTCAALAAALWTTAAFGAADVPHSQLTKIHVPYNWTYADAAARTGAVGLVTADLGKLARQSDTNELWMLIATTPTWVAIGSTNASNLTSGTLPDARFPATLPALSGVNLTALNGSNISSGTVPPGNLGTGASITTKFLRGDSTWQTITSGSGTVTHTGGALTASRLVIGAGTDDVSVLSSLGTTTTVLHGNAAGAPTFGPIVNADVDVAAAIAGSKIQPNFGTQTISAGDLTVSAGGGAGGAIQANTIDASATIAADGNITGASFIATTNQVTGAQNATVTFLNTGLLDGVNVVGYTFDTTDTLVSGGAKIAAFQSGGTLRSYISKSGVYVGAVQGNATTASALATARNINDVPFDGSGNITVTAAGSTLSDTVPVGKGGTGLSSLTAGAIMVGNGTGAVTMVGPGASGKVLCGNVGGDPVFSQLVNLGSGGGGTGAISFNGNTSGGVLVQSADAAGTWTWTIPTDDGNANEFLKTDGAGVTSWAAMPAAAAGTLTGATLAAGVTTSSLTSFGAAIALGTPASGTLTNCTFPTLNQSTTGSAATLTTSRNINGVAFNGSANITVPADAGTLTGATLAAGVTASSLTSVGKVATYNSITTAGPTGIPVVVAVSNLTSQGAAITATTVYAVPAAGAGMYRVAWCASVTRAATTSCTLGGTTAFQVVYTDVNDSVVKTSNPQSITNYTSIVNATGSTVSGTFNVYAKASTNIQYAFGYTSSGATTMLYDLNITVEKL
jgi:hypothetical protein